MRTRTLWIALAILTLAGSITLPAMADPVNTPVNPEGEADVPGDGGGGGGLGGGGNPPPPPPPPTCDDSLTGLVDRCVNEPANNDCAGAIQWPLEQTASSTGYVGGKADPADWSSVWLVRTESLTLTGDTVQYATPNCALLDITYGGNVNVGDDAWYPMKVTSGAAGTPYTLNTGIVPNDAGMGTNQPGGYDIGNTFQSALDYSAFPSDTITKDVLAIKGGLPNRAPLGPDQDWFRVHTIAASQDPGGIALGLLTATFTPDCNAYSSRYEFSLIAPDGSSSVATTHGCGAMQQSCIALSLEPVYVKTAVDENHLGGGYSFSADNSPLHLVTNPGGIVANQYPWCDPLAPLILGLTSAGMGVANDHGQVVAMVTTPFN